MVLASDDIKQTNDRKPATGIWLFFHRWSLLLVLLYGFLGFLFYLFLLLSNHGTTMRLPFRDLSKEALWFSLLAFTGLHFVIFIGSIFMFLHNKVLGLVLVVAALSSVFFANAVINGEINFTSWGILLILVFFLSKWRYSLS